MASRRWQQRCCEERRVELDVWRWRWRWWGSYEEELCSELQGRAKWIEVANRRDSDQQKRVEPHGGPSSGLRSLAASHSHCHSHSHDSLPVFQYRTVTYGTYLISYQSELSRRTSTPNAPLSLVDARPRGRASCQHRKGHLPRPSQPACPCRASDAGRAATPVAHATALVRENARQSGVPKQCLEAWPGILVPAARSARRPAIRGQDLLGCNSTPAGVSLPPGSGLTCLATDIIPTRHLRSTYGPGDARADHFACRILRDAATGLA